MQTKYIEDQFLMEQGPRLLRNNASSVEVLNMFDEINVLHKTAPAIKRRGYSLYLRNNLAFAKVPRRTLIYYYCLIKAKFKLSSRIQKKVKEEDLSVRDFLALFVKRDSFFVEEVMEPVLATIYSGSIDKLSAKATLSVIFPFIRDPRSSRYARPKPISERA